MNVLHSFGRSGYLPLSSHCFGIIGTIDSSQLSTSFFSQSSTADADGRLLDSGPSSTTQVVTSDSHNVSGNPEGGLCGQSPFMTFNMTVTDLGVSLNGWRPVSTCQKVGLTFQRADAYTNLKNRHPNRVDVCARGRESCQKFIDKPELLGIHQLRCHPPGRTPHLTPVTSAPAG